MKFLYTFLSIYTKYILTKGTANILPIKNFTFNHHDTLKNGMPHTIHCSDTTQLLQCDGAWYIFILFSTLPLFVGMDRLDAYIYDKVIVVVDVLTLYIPTYMHSNHHHHRPSFYNTRTYV